MWPFSAMARVRLGRSCCPATLLLALQGSFEQLAPDWGHALVLRGSAISAKAAATSADSDEQLCGLRNI
jgi:hypothetical protein